MSVLTVALHLLLWYLAVGLQAIDSPCIGIYIYTVYRLDQFGIADGHYLFGFLKKKSYCLKPWMEM